MLIGSPLFPVLAIPLQNDEKLEQFEPNIQIIAVLRRNTVCTSNGCHGSYGTIIIIQIYIAKTVCSFSSQVNATHL